ncbi:MAG: hypothetical protein C0456_10760 [Hyphomonas sp.]|nr:hypothetical protein [Hyphomonas sp.]
MRIRVKLGKSAPASLTKQRISRDEDYVIDLCDRVLGLTALRQHRFPFLKGDTGVSGRAQSLPVDAYYPQLQLVIEYHELQHSESVTLFDKRLTISGVSRKEQRRAYDQRRQSLLPQHGLKLVIFDYREFLHTSRKRLMRSEGDKAIIRQKLSQFISR